MKQVGYFGNQERENTLWRKNGYVVCWGRLWVELGHVCELAYIGAQSSKMGFTPSGPTRSCGGVVHAFPH